MGKFTINEWLNNEHEFITKCNFTDKYYLKELGKRLSYFLKGIPIPVVSTYDPTHYKIYFTVGNDKKGFSIDIDISYFDFITIVKRWLINFFPQYEVEKETIVDYTENEILEMRNEAIKLNLKFDTNELLNTPKKVIKIEKGIIEKIMLKSDEFIFNINGNKFVRISGTQNNLLPLSIFLKEVRYIPFQVIKDKLDSEEIEYDTNTDNINFVLKMNVADNEYKEIMLIINHLVQNYILLNSKEVIPINEKDKKILINLTGTKMLNFFKINYSDWKDDKLIQIGNNEYEWGKFKIVFEEDNVKEDCINFYNSMKG